MSRRHAGASIVAMARRFDREAIAALFPGQGSQTADMREEVARLRPDLLDRVADVVGDDPFTRVGDGPRFLQPAIFCASLAGWSAMTVRPRHVVGHSLGELAALTAAGCLDEDDALELVALRGRLCEEAAQLGAPGGMLAVLGRGAEEHAALLAAEAGLVVANENGPRQVVLSGPCTRVADAERRAADAGIIVSVLPVPAAMHSPAMAPAVGPFADALLEIDVRPAQGVTVWSCTTAAPFADVRTELALALTRRVRWGETIEAMVRAGARRYVEVPPGEVLSGLVRRITPRLEPVPSVTQVAA